ncbi:10113_t:CDS:2 [Paraglomus brasilianum]|uniref:10113_t:CDS:1 n=1 Tax=Paraglomus brasilianum TaxID=144538 RepID=A0A9N8ZQI1_9GLOM|nr:10113_t:CDS:2 [Paraglomus brasilianum]
MDSYETPKGGWLGHSFNEFFTRRRLPGTRPIDGPSNPVVIVSPADSAFDGSWDITPKFDCRFQYKRPYLAPVGDKVLEFPARLITKLLFRWHTETWPCSRNRTRGSGQSGARLVV